MTNSAVPGGPGRLTRDLDIVTRAAYRNTPALEAADRVREIMDSLYGTRQGIATLLTQLPEMAALQANLRFISAHDFRLPIQAFQLSQSALRTWNSPFNPASLTLYAHDMNSALRTLAAVSQQHPLLPRQAVDTAADALARIEDSATVELRESPEVPQPVVAPEFDEQFDVLAAQIDAATSGSGSKERKRVLLASALFGLLFNAWILVPEASADLLLIAAMIDFAYRYAEHRYPKD